MLSCLLRGAGGDDQRCDLFCGGRPEVTGASAGGLCSLEPATFTPWLS